MTGTPEFAGFQTADPHRPDVVVAASDEHDVVAAVHHAAAHDLPVAVQATGHGHTTGRVGGVLVTTDRMRGVSVDPAARTARVEAGARSADLVTAAAAHGLAPVSGSFPGVGVVGYTLGGGLGLLGRRYGWASDHLRAAEIVTGDGVLRRVGPGAELFAALRGGRPDVGVVIALTVGLVPLTTVVGGGLFLDAADADRVLPVVRRIGARAPEALGVSLGVVGIPISTWCRRRSAAARCSTCGSSTPTGRPRAPPRTPCAQRRPYCSAGWRRCRGPRAVRSSGSRRPRTRTRAPTRWCRTSPTTRWRGSWRRRGRRRWGASSTSGGSAARSPGRPRGDAVSWREAGWIVRVLSPTDGVPTAAVRASHAAVLAPVAGVRPRRMAGFVYGAAPVAADEVHSPRVRSLLARVREAYDPGRRCG